MIFHFLATDPKEWRQVQKEASCKANYDGRYYFRSKDKTRWYTRDKAGHGHSKRNKGAYLKVYEDKKSTIEFLGSLDVNMQPMPGKHESKLEPSIKKKDMNIVFGTRN